VEVFSSRGAALDANGSPMFEAQTTLAFAKEGGKTKQILRARVMKKMAEAAPYLAGMEEGWAQSLERLAAYMST
jgi:uncharacterized protein YndB with AHSA1/START domain